MAALAVQLRCMTHLTFFVASLLGKSEVETTDSADARLLVRLLTPVVKAATSKVGVAFLSECMECLGGQGYVEEGGIAVLYRDTQVNAIWEGTTNVLADDMLRVLRGQTGSLTLEALDRYILSAVQQGRKCQKLEGLPECLHNKYLEWRERITKCPTDIVTSHARELILSLGRTIGATEMIIDAAFDGDNIEIECCKRVLHEEYLGWEEDAGKTAEWDRWVVFGVGAVDFSNRQARL